MKFVTKINAEMTVKIYSTKQNLYCNRFYCHLFLTAIFQQISAPGSAASDVVVMTLSSCLLGVSAVPVFCDMEIRYYCKALENNNEICNQNNCLNDSKNLQYKTKFVL